jgi:hypothetical protein
VLHQRQGGRVSAVTVFGFAADRARVEVLYTSLLLQAAGQLATGRPSGTRESVAAYRRSWLHGFAVRVHGRLVEAERAAAAAAEEAPDASPGGTGVALVLADRGRQVEQAFAAAFPSLGPARGRSLSGSGFGDGAAAAELADLAARAALRFDGRSGGSGLGARGVSRRVPADA